MAGIKDKVAIVGMGCVKFGELWNTSREDLAMGAAFEAYEDAGIEAKDIQAIWFGTMWSGLSGATLAEFLKTDYVPITRIENFCCTGLDSLRNACYAVASGAYGMVMALGMDKLKDCGFAGLPISNLDPEDTSKLLPQVSPPGMFAFYATRYLSQYGIGYEEGKEILARIAVKNRGNGSLSPNAHFRNRITVEQAMKAPMISWPLGLFDCCGVSDGAAAAIVTTVENAKKMRHDYVVIKGLGMSCGPKEHILNSNYDFCHWEETVRAARQAYAEAGIKDPRKEISLAQVHDCFTSTELIDYEDLGFSPRGKAKYDVMEGTFELDGELPINTDGGLLSFGHPIGASGLRMMYENYKQIQGKAGERQRKDVKLTLAHNLGGAFGQNVVAVTIAGAPA